MHSTRYSSQILMKFELPRQASKNPEVLNFMKICSVGAKLFRADRDIPKLIVHFRNFVNVPKNYFCYTIKK
jgi:hypothetical protein